MSKLSFALLSLILSANALADTDWQNNRLAVLRKVTVGPWDNFEATVSADDKTLYYTQGRNQIPQVYQQNLLTTENTLLVGDQGDAKQPILNSAGDMLALTYYKFDAQGDVCILSLKTLPVETKNIDCVTTNASEDESPFWINNSTLGFLSRDTSQWLRKLNIYDLKTKTTTVVKSDAISAPSSSPNGLYILYNVTTADAKVQLYLHDTIRKSSVAMAAIDLPGITGYTTFSKDGKYVYFNHYLNDTNSDQIIDANDHSVVFRVRFSDWQNAKKRIFPEQLTSVENNCKFPVVTKAQLYVTCAFEGSLDIYRLPIHGMVPTEWTQQQVSEAHSITRSYQERLLLLNVLRYRFEVQAITMTERLLSNHLVIGEFSAAKYYIDQLTDFYQTKKQAKMVFFYKTLGQLIQVRSSKQRIPVGIVTAKFQKLVAEQREKMQSDNSWPEFIELMNTYLDYELKNESQALKRIKNINLSAPMLPLQRYLGFAIIQLLLEKDHPQEMLDYYPIMFNLPDVSTEAKLYYAFHYLQLLSKLYTDQTLRIKTVEQQLVKVNDNSIKALLQTEVVTLKLANSIDDKEKRGLFSELKKLLKHSKDNALQRKVLHTTAIKVLGDAEEFKYMELLSRHWLITTQVSEMEFVNVAEQYALITMDKAYGMLADDEPNKAYTTFYSAIRQTNDLEAHYQFVTLGLNASLNKRDNLEKSYAILKRKNLLQQNVLYVEALRLIIETEASNGLTPSSIDVYKKAISLLTEMRIEGLNPAMRDLLLGYSYHKLFRLSQNRFFYDKTLFKKAHYHYMMALDLGRDNSRISATIWENLSWLQFEVRQYALATDFFAKRLQFPFSDQTAEINTRWSYARALFYNNQASKAAEQAEKVLTLVSLNKKMERAPFVEKTAFYAMQAKLYQQAVTHYEALFLSWKTTAANNTFHQLNQAKVNQAKAKMAYSYALLKLNQTDKAKNSLVQLAKQLQTLDVIPADSSRLLPFHPERLSLLVNGFLAKLSNDPLEKITYRRNRISIWKNMQGQTAEFAYKESERLSFMIKDYQHIVAALAQQQDYLAMSKPMEQSLLVSKEWLEETGDKTGPVMYRSLVNFLSTALSHPKGYSDKIKTVANDLCAQTLSEYAQLTYRPDVIVGQENKLKTLCSSYRGT